MTVKHDEGQMYVFLQILLYMRARVVRRIHDGSGISETQTGGDAIGSVTRNAIDFRGNSVECAKSTPIDNGANNHATKH
jgi:hypothetical protein